MTSQAKPTMWGLLALPIYKICQKAAMPQLTLSKYSIYDN